MGVIAHKVFAGMLGLELLGFGLELVRDLDAILKFLGSRLEEFCDSCRRLIVHYRSGSVTRLGVEAARALCYRPSTGLKLWSKQNAVLCLAS